MVGLAAVLALTGTLVLLTAAAAAWSDRTEDPGSAGELEQCGAVRPAAMAGAALLMVEHRAVVVRAKQSLVAVLFTSAGEREPVVPAHALLTFDHHAYPHAEAFCLDNVGTKAR